MKTTAPKLYGVMAQFDNPSTLVAAARETYAAGYRQVNGYSPFPIEGLAEAIGKKFPAIVTERRLGGVFAWGLGEDAVEWKHLQALTASVRNVSTKYKYANNHDEF